MSTRENKRGLLIPACTVARALGRDPETIRGWIDAGVLRGEYILPEGRKRGRWYVWRASFDAFKAKSERPATE